MQLRYLQTLNSIATEQNSTIIFPLPVDLFSLFQKNQFNVVKTSTNSFASIPTLTPSTPDDNHININKRLTSTDI
jgi:hypothetical protein